MTVANLATITKILDAASAAMQIGIELQKRAALFQSLHAQGKTLSNDELTAHLNTVRQHLAELKKLGEQPLL